MKQLIIIGARGFGREVYTMSCFCKCYGTEFVVKGFLDDDSNVLNGMGEYPPILGPVETYSFKEDDVFVVALGNPQAREKYANIALNNGGIPYTLIHNMVRISPLSHIQIGKGCIIFGEASISTEVIIRDYSVILDFAILGHDVTVGQFCHVGCFSFCGGGVNIQDRVVLHPHSYIVPHRTVGKDAIVGAASVVLRNVKPNTTVFGSPAKRVDY